MRGIVSFCLLVLSFTLCAEATLPTGCKPITVLGEAVTVKGNKSKLVFIHNLSKTDLWITHPVTDPSASAGWSSRLQPDNWSALVVDKSDFILTCIESRPGHEQQIPCEGAMAVCEWNKVKMPTSAQGSFWVDEDKSLLELTAATGARGYVLPTVK